MSNIIVTGASSGFGKLTSEALLKAGHSVVGTMRDITGRNRNNAEQLRSMGGIAIEMDVTDDKSTEMGITEAIDHFGTIDVLINNAGLGAHGLIEGFTTEQMEKIFAVNVFGVHRVNRAILPHMKERQQGLLIQISSLTGRLTIPFQGPYTPSKWAVEALAELYRVELSQLGIESCIIEPGGFPTTFLEHLILPHNESRLASYGEVSELPGAFLSSFEQVFASNPAQNPQLVADAVVDLIAKPTGERPFRTIVDEMGLGTQVLPYNEHLEKMTTDVYTSFEIAHLLQTRVIQQKFDGN